MAPKINVRDRLNDDGEIDLSMSDLQDVPVKEIAVLKKAYSLDLSNNHLVKLPKNFPTLVHISKLDLSKNNIVELPEDFGNLIKLTYLDLYQNKLEHLPLSIGKLKALKWLDLKDNPLIPAVSKVAGDCQNAKQCQTCAKNVVAFFAKLEDNLNEEREQQKKKQQEKQQKKMTSERQAKKKEKHAEKNSKSKDSNSSQKNKESVSAQKNNKKEKKKSKKTTPDKSESWFSLFFLSFITFSIIFFVLSSLQVERLKPITESIVKTYQTSIESLPANVKPYAHSFGDMVKSVHDKTGRVSEQAIDFLKNNQQLNIIYKSATDVVLNATKTVQELYNKNFKSN